MKRYIMALATAMLLWGCGSHVEATHDEHNDNDGHDHGAAAQASQAEEKEEHHHQGGIVLAAAQAAELGLEYQKVEPAEFQGAIHTSGIIEPAVGDVTTIVATSGGIVSGLSANIGSQLGKGAKLLTISSSEMTDNNLSARYHDAQAELQKAQAEYNRVEKLYADKLATAAEMESAKLALSRAGQQIKTLGGGDKGRAIVSPAGGYITALNVSNGDFVAEGQPLATVSADRSLVVRGDLPARHFAQAGLVKQATFVTPYDNKSYTARLLSKGAATNQNSYTLPVRFSVDNRAELVAGSAVELYMLTAPRANVIAVPVGALTEELGGYFVYIRTCEDDYAKRHVTIGQKNGTQVEILSGLVAGDNVVTKGAYFVRLASLSNAIPSGHQH